MRKLGILALVGALSVVTAPVVNGDSYLGNDPDMKVSFDYGECVVKDGQKVAVHRDGEGNVLGGNYSARPRCKVVDPFLSPKKKPSDQVPVLVYLEDTRRTNRVVCSQTDPSNVVGILYPYCDLRFSMVPRQFVAGEDVCVDKLMQIVSTLIRCGDGDWKEFDENDIDVMDTLYGDIHSRTKELFEERSPIEDGVPIVVEEMPTGPMKCSAFK